jgi:hypothetical protein
VVNVDGGFSVVGDLKEGMQLRLLQRKHVEEEEEEEEDAIFSLGGREHENE